ncbi:MAG: Adaptive-response sensory-kinase SasA [Candidatus Udaeobacter sp.]|nr:MAG: Adaptive-response sensory-kinase SasA [Candidatus Udaeobacter sp.]
MLVSHEKKPRISKRVSGLPLLGILVVIYFIAGKLGLMLASLHASASPVWPPAGIALAALLVLGYRAWPAIFVGAFLVNVTTAGNVATSLAVASGNTLEALVGTWLVNRFAGGTIVFDRPQGVFKFALAAGISTIISPAFGVTSLALAGFADWTNYGTIWLTWWLGDTTGDLLIAPLIILWSIASKRRWNRREAVEVGIHLLLLFVLSEAVFGGWLTISAEHYPIAFICGAIVIWTAFRFTQRETATGIFVLSAIAIWGTLHGFGPFIGETKNQSLLALQSWTAVLTITAMALSAGMAERRRAEEALRESEARINLAANAANLGLWVWNLRDDELWVTDKWRKLFGFAESEPVNFGQLTQRVHPEDRELMKQRVQHMLEDGGVDRESEYRITRPDGSTRWIAGYGGVELDERGKPSLARGVSRDITERKIAEEELRETQERMELAASAAELGMWMWDIVRDEIWITDKGRDLFGVRPSEKIDFDRFRNMLHPEDRESVLKALENSLRTGAQYNSEYRAVLPDGQLRWIAGRGHVEFNGEGQPIRMRGASLDITKRKQAEEHFRLATDAGGLIVWSWDIRRDEVSLSEKDRAFLGFSQEEKLNAERVRSVVHPEDRKLVRRLVEKSLHTREETEAEYRVVLPDGEVRWVTRRGRVEFDGNGEPIWERGVLMDITERKQAELEAARHRHELAHLSRVTMLGELSGSLAHELNQPLAAILSNAQAAQQFLKEDVFDVNELRQVLAEIVAEDKRAGEVIRHVRLLFRKGEVGQHFGNLHINEVVQDVLKLMRNDLANQGVTVQTELAENLPAVQGDRVQLQQVLLNLMLNGCEAMIDRDPSECQLLITSGMENSVVHVSVRDRGGSIPEETMERVFEPFFTTKAHGMGLGLSVCRTIIEAHRGNICVRNNADGGATFHFSIPCTKSGTKK